MGLVDTYGIQVKHGSEDITNHVISYNWSKKVCTGIGLLTVIVEHSIIDSIGISDDIKIYEEGMSSHSRKTVRQLLEKKEIIRVRVLA